MSSGLRCGDCLDIMAEMDDDSVDVVITDPPYPGLVGGYNRQALHTNKRASVTVGDEWQASLEWVSHAKRIARLGAIVFCSYHSVVEVAMAFSDWRRVALLTWYKRNAAPTGKNVPRFTNEFIWCFARQPGLRWDALKTTVFDIPTLSPLSGERILDGTSGTAAHPTQKPLSLMRCLIEIAHPGMTILDPFMGTGTTGVAAIRAGCKFVGIEIDPLYYDIARRRIEKAAWQPRLL